MSAVSTRVAKYKNDDKFICSAMRHCCGLHCTRDDRKNDRLMVLTTIYLVRHGFRGNWTVDSRSGTYSAGIAASPTGIPSDPMLTAHGIAQARQLGEALGNLKFPRIRQIYSSPYYRCCMYKPLSHAYLSQAQWNSNGVKIRHLLFYNVQERTIQPYAEICAEQAPETKVRIDLGLGEWHGQAHFVHPSPASISVLSTYFPWADQDWKSNLVPNPRGETIRELHDRSAHILAQIIATEDAQHTNTDDNVAILICSHAAPLIAMGRVLTGHMPEDVHTVDFNTFTAGISKFVRRPEQVGKRNDDNYKAISSDEKAPSWTGGEGVGGGWDCVVNSDCSHLSNGAERGWHFSDEEAFSHPSLTTDPGPNPQKNDISASTKL